MPQNVSVKLINGTLPTKVQISWKQGFDGNSPITKHVVEIRTMGPSCKFYFNNKLKKRKFFFCSIMVGLGSFSR